MIDGRVAFGQEFGAPLCVPRSIRCTMIKVAASSSGIGVAFERWSTRVIHPIWQSRSPRCCRFKEQSPPLREKDRNRVEIGVSVSIADGALKERDYQFLRSATPSENTVTLRLGTLQENLTEPRSSHISVRSISPGYTGAVKRPLKPPSAAAS